MPSMPLPLSGVTPLDLAPWLGQAERPALIDVCLADDAALLGRAIPGSQTQSFADVRTERAAILICAQGKKLSQGAAAQLRAQGTPATHLIGGLEAWIKADLPTTARMAAGLYCAPAENFAAAAFMRWLTERFAPMGSTLMTVAAETATDVADRFGADLWRDPAEALRALDLSDPTTLGLAKHLTSTPWETLLSGIARIHGTAEAGQTAALPLFDAAYAGARP